jgi:hypothetical protein
MDVWERWEEREKRETYSQRLSFGKHVAKPRLGRVNTLIQTLAA